MTLKTKLMKRLRPIFSQPPYVDAEEFLLSVSGGLDSMVMLDVFFRMKHVHRTPIRVVHIHHNTGAFADLSQEIVTNACKARDLELVVGHFKWDGAGNFEFEAAQYRKQLLEAERASDGWVVLAHHAQDQSETLIQTLVRGAGLTTPLGMSPNKARRLRPFLNLNRDLLAEHAGLAGVPHALDPGNHKTNGLRNVLRHKLLPVLRQFHQSFDKGFSGWLDDYRGLQEALADQARVVFDLHFKNGTLAREAFSQPKYLWDFILQAFWDHHQYGKPQRKEATQLKSWMLRGETGVFNFGDRLCWFDLDGLCICDPTPNEPMIAPVGEAVTWGPWLFHWQGSQTLHLVPGTPPGKRIKEHFRQECVPYRYRRSLPDLIVEGKPLHPGEWNQRINLKIEHAASFLPETKPKCAHSNASASP